jgi:hypothetical protein
LNGIYEIEDRNWKKQIFGDEKDGRASAGVQKTDAPNAQGGVSGVSKLHVPPERAGNPAESFEGDKGTSGKIARFSTPLIRILSFFL